MYIYNTHTMSTYVQQIVLRDRKEKKVSTPLGENLLEEQLWVKQRF